jgi:hypothetical protein
METIGSSGHLNAMAPVDKVREKGEWRPVGRCIRRRHQFPDITQSRPAQALGAIAPVARQGWRGLPVPAPQASCSQNIPTPLWL